MSDFEFDAFASIVPAFGLDDAFWLAKALVPDLFRSKPAPATRVGEGISSSHLLYPSAGASDTSSQACCWCLPAGCTRVVSDAGGRFPEVMAHAKLGTRQGGKS
jgi:hypothetical protein